MYGWGHLFIPRLLDDLVELIRTIREQVLHRSKRRWSAASNLTAHECPTRSSVLAFAAQLENVGEDTFVVVGGGEAAAVSGLGSTHELVEVAESDYLTATLHEQVGAVACEAAVGEKQVWEDSE